MDNELLFKQSKQYWDSKYLIAKQNMDSHQNFSPFVLIEVASQHPLKEQKYPSDEFALRLDKAYEIYISYKNKGISVNIYVPGSRHMFDNIEDEISLSEAGINYLINKGVPKKDLLGDEKNILYKGEDGVYNAGDECYVTSLIFKNGQYSSLICVCSVNQMPRKYLFYLEFEVIAKFYTVTSETMFHDNFIAEIFGSFNNVLYFDHSWQDPKSFIYIESRKQRKPK